MSRLARDVLAIPVSTVASESAFSTGGRVIDPFRSNLSPNMVEALICTQNWLRCQSEINLRDKLNELELLDSGNKLYYFKFSIISFNYLFFITITLKLCFLIFSACGRIKYKRSNYY
ncbi:hypothetical protein U1Q18_052498 [Sarracenia purpurea var. burkii]